MTLADLNNETETTENVESDAITFEQAQQLLNQAMGQLTGLASASVEIEKAKAKAQVKMAQALGPEQYLELRRLEMDHERRQSEMVWKDVVRAFEFLGSHAPRLFELSSRAIATDEVKAEAYSKAVEQLKELAESGKYKVEVNSWGFELEPVAAK